MLVKFIADYPKSELKTRAEESLAGARAAMADERLSSGDTPTAVLALAKVIPQGSGCPCIELAIKIRIDPGLDVCAIHRRVSM